MVLATVTFPEQIRRWTSPPAEGRLVACFECGRRVQLIRDVVSLVCPFCNAFIETSRHEVTGLHTRGIRTRGPVIIQTRARYDGPKLIAGLLEVHGVLESEYVCDELVLGRLAKLQSAGEQRALHVLPGGRVVVKLPLEAVDARIGGVLEVEFLDVAGTLYLPRGGAVIADKVRAGGIIVEKGARLECALEIAPRVKPPEPKADAAPVAETAGAGALAP